MDNLTAMFAAICLATPISIAAKISPLFAGIFYLGIYIVLLHWGG